MNPNDYRLTEEFVESAASRLLGLGCTMKFKDKGLNNTVITTHAPVTLQPIKLTKPSFDAVTEIAPLWNTVIDNVARDFEFVCETLAGSAASDPAFTGRYLQMLKDIYMGPKAVFQPIMLGMFRSDYLRNANSTGPEDDWKHVEINTIAVSFAGLNPPVSDFHKFVAANDPVNGKQALLEMEKGAVRSHSDKALPSGLAGAHNAWMADSNGSRKQESLPCYVVLVAQEGERNTGDQFLLTHELLMTHGVQTVRMTMKEISEQLTFEEVDGGNRPAHAVINNNFYVSLFYFRSSYTEKDFPTDAEWKGREVLERSSAVKCPSLPYYLCTMKKIQKALFDYKTLCRFSNNEAEAKMLARSFVGQFSLEKIGDAETEAKIADAIANPQKYVLKPQLEGGGNLIHGDAMLKDLSTTEKEDATHFKHVRNEYILMERIIVKELDGILLRREKAYPFFRDGAGGGEGLCYELGTFGVLISNGSSTFSAKKNEYAGYLFRTKRTKDEDGGVMTGVACLDSLILVDSE